MRSEVDLTTMDGWTLKLFLSILCKRHSDDRRTTLDRLVNRSFADSDAARAQ